MVCQLTALHAGQPLNSSHMLICLWVYLHKGAAHGKAAFSAHKHVAHFV